MIRITLEELQNLVYKMENASTFEEFQDIVNVSFKIYTNGIIYIEFEQPSLYFEYSSKYYTFKEKR